MKPYLQDGAITLYHGKCEDVLPTLDASSIDLVLSDPCYGTTQLDWDIPADWSILWPEVYRVSKPTALQVLFSAQPFTTDLITSNRKRFRYDLVWPKTMPTGFLDANRRPLRAHETVVVFADKFGGSTYNPQKTLCKPEREHRSPVRLKEATHYGKTQKTLNTSIITERHPTTVLPAFSNGHGGKSDHETTKPLDLISWLILTYSNPGDTVLDPFIGSGTTAEACKQLGRRCIGVDIRESCLQVAKRRLYQEVFSFDEATL